MIGVSPELYRAAHAYGPVSRAGGRRVTAPLPALAGYTVDGGTSHREVQEFADAAGVVIARKVTALDSVECWLREDLAAEAEAALQRSAAETARVIAEVSGFIRSTDQQGAARNGVSVEQYRQKRHAAGMRWDRYRHAQRAGG